MLQTILFDKKKYTLPQAKAWLTKHNYKTTVDIKENFYRFRQIEPDHNAHYVTVKKKKGIYFVMMY